MNKMSESTSVGNIHLGIKITQESIQKEIKRVSSSIGDSFRDMFRSMGKQTTGHVKDTVSRMNNSVKTFAQTGTKASDNVAKSTERMQAAYAKTETQIKSLQSRLAGLYAEQDKIIRGYMDMPTLGGLSKDESLDKMLGSDARFAELTAEIDKLEAKIGPLAAKTKQLADKIKLTGNAAKESAQKFKLADTGARNLSKTIKATTPKMRNFGKEMKRSTGTVAGFGVAVKRTFRTIARRIAMYYILMRAIRSFSSYVMDSLRTNEAFSRSLNQVKTNLKVAFTPIYQAALPALNTLMNTLATATTYLAAFTSALFGKTYKQSFEAVEGLDATKKAMAGAGAQAKKTAKDMKGLAAFDELNLLSGDKVDVGGGEGVNVEDGMVAPDPNIFEAADKAAQKFKDTIKDLAGMINVSDFAGKIREGLAMVDLGAIKNNLKSAFADLGDIAKTYISAMVPVARAEMKALGTALKYGIAIAGNLFEPISEGFARFTSNMKQPIKDWMWSTSEKMAQGFENLSTVFELIGSSWLGSIMKYKPQIADVFEDIYTNTANTFMLLSTIISGAWEIVTKGIADFAINNKSEIQKFTDGVIGIFVKFGDVTNHIWEGLIGILTTAWNTWGKGIVDLAVEALSDVGRWMLKIYNGVIIPIWDYALGTLQEIWDEGLGELVSDLSNYMGLIVERFKLIWQAISPVVEAIIDFLIPAVKAGFENLIDMVKHTVSTIVSLARSIVQILTGVLDFILGIFTGDWERAWNGIKEIFAGVINGIVGVAEAGINGIITSINGVLKGANAIKIPDWVPGLGGKGINIPLIPKLDIPKLAAGGIVDQPTLAMVGERGREAVVPLENNTGWMDTLAQKVTAAITQTTTKDNNSGDLIIRVGEIDFARIAIKAINNVNRLAGTTLLEV